MDSIGGFRLIRRLGSGGRAEVHLGHSTVSTDEASPRVAAIKVFRPTTPLESIDGEIDVVGRLSSPYLTSLRDLAIANDGRPVMILERLGPMTCSRLVLERQQLEPGEAVNVLAPLIDAVEELMRVHVVHGGIRLDRVGFDGVGTPVLMGFGHARVIGAAIQAQRDGTRRAGHGDVARGDDVDTGDLAALSRTLLEATRSSRARRDLVAWLGCPFDDAAAFRAELRERVFDLAAPEAVSLVTRHRIPIMPAGESGDSLISREPATGPEPPLAAVHRLVPAALPTRMHELSTRAPDAVGRWIAHGSAAIRGFVAPVRRPIWLAAGCVAILLVAATVNSGTGVDGNANALPISTEDGASTSSAVPGPQPADTGASETAVPDTPKPEDAAAIAGDDIVAAGAALLRARAECLRQESVTCLDRTDQRDSAALEADTALIRALQDGEDGHDVVDLTGVAPATVENLGGTVILALDIPAPEEEAAPLHASVLLVRGEAGWRIRDVIIG